MVVKILASEIFLKSFRRDFTYRIIASTKSSDGVGTYIWLMETEPTANHCCRSICRSVVKAEVKIASIHHS